MSFEALVGTVRIRVATIVLAGATLATYAITQGRSPAVYVVIVGAVLSLLGFIHSFRSVYRGWMRGAEAIHGVVITILFGLCYLVVVPLVAVIVWFRDPLGLRRRSHGTAWITRAGASDAASLERMG